VYQNKVMPSTNSYALNISAAALLLANIAVAHAQAPARDPMSLANIGRTNLTQSLDDIAAKDTAARRATVAAIHTRAEAEARQKAVRTKILGLLGTLPDRTPLNAKVLGTTQAEGFRIEKILFDSQPGFHVTALLYIPDNKTGKQPAILMAPGHSPAGKAGDYAMAAAFAHNGFVVLSYDPIGQGERLQYPDPNKPDTSLATRPTGEHGEAGLQPTLLGDAVARYFLWDAMRGIDYLITRPEVDPKRIGAFGCSGGGMMTALTAALDTRVAVAGIACYTTSFDTLLPSIGPQDGEQSIPHFIADGLDFPDWIELAAPRPYAAIATYSDMFPFAGARSTVQEARRFYALFDPTSAGTRSKELSSFGEAGGPASVPTAPALNADTTNTVPLTAHLQFITGPGTHGALQPITGNILSFFLRNLQPGADADHPILPPPRAPRAAGAPITPPSTGLPKDALQVTPTGQVATSYPNSATVYTLNRKRYEALPKPKPLTLTQLQQVIRDLTGASIKPTDPAPINTQSPDLASPSEGAAHVRHRFTLATAPGINIQAEFYRPLDDKQPAGKHPVLIVLKDNLDPALEPSRVEEIKKYRALADASTAVLVIAPRPSPPGTEETKSPILGPFYLTSLRAELVNKTILGLRVDDVIAAITFASGGTTADPNQITAQASGHLGLVLMHAALLDPRLKHITVDHVLTSYQSLIEAPLPTGAPEDIIPGVVRHYDIPDLAKALGPRLTQTDPLEGTDDLSRTSKAIAASASSMP
jgi:dienelactone hydrolase